MVVLAEVVVELEVLVVVVVVGIVVVLVGLIVSKDWERRVRHVAHVPNINREDCTEDVVTSNRVSDNR